MYGHIRQIQSSPDGNHQLSRRDRLHIPMDHHRGQCRCKTKHRNSERKLQRLEIVADQDSRTIGNRNQTHNHEIDICISLGFYIRPQPSKNLRCEVISKASQDTHEQVRSGDCTKPNSIRPEYAPAILAPHRFSQTPRVYVLLTRRRNPT